MEVQAWLNRGIHDQYNEQRTLSTNGGDASISDWNFRIAKTMTVPDS